MQKILELKISEKHRSDLFDVYNKYLHYRDNEELPSMLEARDEFNLQYENFSNPKYIHLLEKCEKTYDTKTLNLDMEILSFLDKSCASFETKEAIFKQYRNIRNYANDSSEKQYFNKWINWVKDLPIHEDIRLSKDRISIDFIVAEKYIQVCSEILNSRLYGLKKEKIQILSILHERYLNKNYSARTIGWIGPPGVGKTSLAMTFAECEKREFYKLSLSSHDSESIDGSANVFTGAEPGGIIKGLCKNKSLDGVFFIDEFEKYVNTNNKLAPKVLEILDPQYNKEFRDQYISHFTVDLSKTCFMVSCNSYPSDSAIENRIDWVHVEEYTREEKEKIICDYILPKFAKYYSLPRIKINKSALQELLSLNGKGIRDYENIISKICRMKYLNMSYKIPNIDSKVPWEITKEEIVLV